MQHGGKVLIDKPPKCDISRILNLEQVEVWRSPGILSCENVVGTSDGLGSL